MSDLPKYTNMAATSTQNDPAKNPTFMNKVKRFFIWLSLLIVLILTISVYFKYFYTYSDGYRAGLLQKFSHKGNIFKTYEGEMILSSVSSTNNVAIASEKFIFSVVNKGIVRQLDTIQGETVIVHYIQKKRSAFWRGDSEYLVDSVKVKR
jgi:hypothetical protein